MMTFFYITNKRKQQIFYGGIKSNIHVLWSEILRHENILTRLSAFRNALRLVALKTYFLLNVYFFKLYPSYTHVQIEQGF